MSEAKVKVLPHPQELKNARAWFESNYSDEEISAALTARNGKVGGLVYLPPLPTAQAEFLVNLITETYKTLKNP